MDNTGHADSEGIGKFCIWLPRAGHVFQASKVTQPATLATQAPPRITRLVCSGWLLAQRSQLEQCRRSSSKLARANEAQASCKPPRQSLRGNLRTPACRATAPLSPAAASPGAASATLAQHAACPGWPDHRWPCCSRARANQPPADRQVWWIPCASRQKTVLQHKRQLNVF